MVTFLSFSSLLLIIKSLIQMVEDVLNGTETQLLMLFTTHEKSKIPFSYMLCLFCKRAYRGTKPEESFG